MTEKKENVHKIVKDCYEKTFPIQWYENSNLFHTYGDVIACAISKLEAERNEAVNQASRIYKETTELRVKIEGFRKENKKLKEDRDIIYSNVMEALRKLDAEKQKLATLKKNVEKKANFHEMTMEDGETIEQIVYFLQKDYDKLIEEMRK